MASVLYVYIILLLCFGCVTKVPGRCYVPYTHESENLWEQRHVEIGFSYVKYN